MTRRPASAVRAFAGRVFRWPTFLGLAVVHAAVLPPLLSEHEDDVVALVAAGAYLLLAAVDGYWLARAAHRESRSAGRRIGWPPDRPAPGGRPAP
jgi:hypothetical protein